MEKAVSKILMTTIKNHAMLQAMAEFQIEVAAKSTGLSKDILKKKFTQILSRHFERAKLDMESAVD
ncbi:MAG: hypothetical protein AAF570_00520 [Bacteroidota bacterium]